MYYKGWKKIYITSKSTVYALYIRTHSLFELNNYWYKERSPWYYVIVASKIHDVIESGLPTDAYLDNKHILNLSIIRWYLYIIIIYFIKYSIYIIIK